MCPGPSGQMNDTVSYEPQLEYDAEARCFSPQDTLFA